MDRPRLRAHLVPVPTGKRVFLLTETDSFLIDTPAQLAVLPLLDGTRTVADVAVALAGQQPLSAVLAAIEKLRRAGLLAGGTSSLPSQETAWFDAVSADPVVAGPRLSAAQVEVRGIGADPSGTVAALRAGGLQVHAGSDPVGSADLCVLVVDDYLNPALDAINRDFTARGRTWLLVKPGGVTAWVGPVFLPGTGACWECLRQRMDSNRMVEQYLRRFGDLADQVVLSVAALPATRSAAESLAAAAVVALIGTGTSPQLTDRLVTLDTTTFATAAHQVVRLPQCRVCGDPKVMHTDPRLELETDGAVAFTADGGFRTMPPEATYSRLSKHVSRISGAVTWLEPLPSDDSGLAHAYTAGHNFAMIRNNMAVLKKNLRGHSGGKGRTDIQAKVSGMCEAVERFSGVWSEDRPTISARADQLTGRRLLPNELMLFADEQIADRERVNADPDNQLHRVPNPFDESLTVDWSAAWSLTRDEPVWVPSAYVWFGHPDSTEHFFTYSDGNGNAAGNTLAEAVLQGFFEIVERDAAGIWWYNRLSRPAVDLAAFADPYIDALLAHYGTMRRSLWLLDLTTDLGIPVFAAVSRREDSPVEDIIVAFGAHLDPKLAALRALTEANQFLPSVSERDASGRAVYIGQDPATLAWWTGTTLSANPWLAPAGRAARIPTDYPLPVRSTVAEYVSLCVERATAAGHEVLAIDQSRPDIELRVAKVMVPGLRHFWRRLGPGRLYDQPVAAGDLTRPHRLDELNPVSVFF